MAPMTEKSRGVENGIQNKNSRIRPWVSNPNFATVKPGEKSFISLCLSFKLSLIIAVILKFGEDYVG